ncbi:MAG: ParB/RepB/Spo0J family partition protein [Nitrospirae bacterium]|nr:ParB/RepB/Spo0J family partition protein [Nitrospirota bacterium]
MLERFDQGRGLDESIKRMRAEGRVEKVLKIPVDKIRPNPFQPRRFFDQNALEELAKSIKQDGLNEPVIVRKVNEEDSEFLFELIAGERRLRAVKLLGEQAIDAIIKDYDDHRTKRIGLVENIQRENLNTVEIAYGIKSLKNDYEEEYREQNGVMDEKAVIETIANEIGKDGKTVGRYLRIYEGVIAVPEMEALFRGHSDRISFRDAKEYAGVADKLRSLKKSNNREYGRILKKLTKSFSDKKDRESIRKAVDYLHQYFNKDKKSTGDAVLTPHELFFETGGKLVLNVEVRKNSVLTVEDISCIEEACRQFVMRIQAFRGHGE